MRARQLPPVVPGMSRRGDEPVAAPEGCGAGRDEAGGVLDIARERTVPALLTQHLLELHGPAVERSGVLERLHALRTVGQRDDQGEPVPLNLLIDLTPQVLAAPLVEPNHCVR